MNVPILTLVLVSILLAGCASSQDTAATVSAHIADTVPRWLGGMPSDVPPRRGTPEYDAWTEERAKEAARIKTGPTSN